MTFFEQRDVKAAFLFAEQGGQALHASRKKGHAQLIDHDMERLMATALRLGVRKVKVERAGRAGSHVELTGAALDRAIAETRALELALAP